MKENFDKSFAKLIRHEGWSLVSAKNACDVVNGLSASQTEFDRISAASPPGSKAADGVSYTVHGESADGSQIVCLFSRSRPSTIFGFVIAVDIDSIQSRTRWSRSHISVERLKRNKPFSTDGDAATAPQMKSFITGVKAPISHACPVRILRAAPQSMCFVCNGSHFVSVTSTRCRVPRQQFVGVGFSGSATLTQTKPSFYRLAVGVCARSANRQNGQTSELLANQIYRFSHVRPSRFPNLGVINLTPLLMGAQ